MMVLIRAARYEIWRMLDESKIILIACVFFLIANQIAFLIQMNPSFNLTQESELRQMIGRFSAGDLIMFVNRGMEPYNPAAKRFFLLDMVWAVPYFLIGFLTCSAFRHETKLEAYQVVPRIRSRSAWIASKYMRALLVVIFYTAMEFLIAILLSLVFGGSTSLLPTAWSATVSHLTYQNIDINSITMACLLILLTLLAYAIFSIPLSMIFGASVAYLFLIVFVVASAYFDAPWLFLGNSMIARSLIVSADWSSAVFEVFVCAVVLVISLACGFIPTRKVELR